MKEIKTQEVYDKVNEHNILLLNSGSNWTKTGCCLPALQGTVTHDSMEIRLVKLNNSQRI